MEVEEGQSGTQHPSQTQPHGGDQSSDLFQLQTAASAEALSENWNQKEIPVDVQEKADPTAQNQPQAKPLWKPIPPLLPEPEPHQSTDTKTRDQSCQTDETSSNSHGHNGGG